MISDDHQSASISRNLFTLTQTKTLQAVAERIFPQTDTPGALEAGALDYLTQALKGDYASSLRLYRHGLRALERCAQEKFGEHFSVITDEQKDSLLMAFEAGEAADFKRAAEFFDMVRNHVLEGVFCEPQYGGNKGMVGWRMVNFPGQQYGYADAYINRPVDLPLDKDTVEKP
jgi:gluconate 2-dehydrogenase gamma chain